MVEVRDVAQIDVVLAQPGAAEHPQLAIDVDAHRVVAVVVEAEAVVALVDQGAAGAAAGVPRLVLLFSETSVPAMLTLLSGSWFPRRRARSRGLLGR